MKSKMEGLIQSWSYHLKKEIVPNGHKMLTKISTNYVKKK